MAIRQLALLVAGLAMTGCGREDGGSAAPSSSFRVVLQTDWFAQPEHGGFYQALAKGYYEEAGLEVEILQGGPNAMTTQKVLKGTAHFAMNRADTIYGLATRGVGIVMVMATLQNDPQALLLHASNPINSFHGLDGQRVMAVPGLAWIRWLEARYGIKMEILPHDFGLQRFIQDPEFIQQCLLTSEPFHALQAGVETKVLPLRESGFNPYHGVYCLNSFAEEHPDVVARFVAASIRGWRDFALGDPAPALALIAEANPRMNAEFMDFSYRAMLRHALITGDDPHGGLVGQLDPARMEGLVEEMRRLGLIDTDEEPPAPWYSTRFLVKPADEPVRALP